MVPTLTPRTNHGLSQMSAIWSIAIAIVYLTRESLDSIVWASILRFPRTYYDHAPRMLFRSFAFAYSFRPIYAQRAGLIVENRLVIWQTPELQGLF